MRIKPYILFVVFSEVFYGSNQAISSDRKGSYKIDPGQSQTISGNDSLSYEQIIINGYLSAQSSSKIDANDFTVAVSNNASMLASGSGTVISIYNDGGSHQFTVGSNGYTGDLTVSNGAIINALDSQMSILFSIGGNGTENSSTHNGGSSSGYVTVGSGGIIAASIMAVGNSYGPSVSELNVSGSGSKVIAGTIYDGAGSSVSSIDVGDGGVISITNNLILDNDRDAVAKFSLNDGGYLDIGKNAGIKNINNIYEFDLNGGTIAIDNNNFSSSISMNAVNEKKSTVEVNGSSSVLSGNIYGGGSILKSGVGTLILTGSNTYTGDTTISGGTLALSGTGSISQSSGVHASVVNDGATFDISGVTTGSSSIKSLDGAGAISLGNNTLDITNGNNTFGNIYSGIIYGSGGLTISGGQEILTGSNNYKGDTTIRSGTLQLGNGGATGEIQGTGAIHDNGTLIVNRFNTVTLAQNIDGTGGLTQEGKGTTILTGANTYTGDTTISSGVLQLGNGGTTGDVQGTIHNNSFLYLNRSNILTLAGNIDGTGQLFQEGKGQSVLTGLNTYTGDTFIDHGTLKLSGAGSISQSSAVHIGQTSDNNTVFDISGVTTGSASIKSLDGIGSVDLGSNTLNITRGQGYTDYSGIIYGSGALALSGGQETLGGINTYTGDTTISGGTLALDGTGSISQSSGVHDGARFDISDVTTGSSEIKSLDGSGSVVLGRNTLKIANGNNTFGNIYSGSISGTGSFILSGGQETLTGTNTYIGDTTISNGTLQLGNGSTTGDIADSAAIYDNGMLAVDHSDTFTLAQNIYGTGDLIQEGTGTLILSGINSYKGTTSVKSGVLQVDGNQSASTGLTTVSSGATLSGTGTVGGNVLIDSGATLSAGDGLNRVGSLTIGGNLSLLSGSQQHFNIGQANVAGGAYNDLVVVDGDLKLGGMLNISANTSGPDVSKGNFDPGVYRLYTYDGTLSGVSNQSIVVTKQFSGDSLGLQTVIDHQVNLVINNGTLNFWDGDNNGTNHGSDGLSGNNKVDGGSGNWSAINGVGDNNWTNSSGSRNISWYTGGFSIFEGSAGKVNVVDQDINGKTSDVFFNGMQFANNDGKTYIITGDDLYASSKNTEIRVGDGTTSGASITADLNTVINQEDVNGGTSLIKSDDGTLIITKNQTYTGDTTIRGGILQLGNGGTTGDITNSTAIHDNAILAIDRSDTVTLNQAIDGTGALHQMGTGTTVLTGANTYTGGTTISNGTLVGTNTSFGSGTIEDYSNLNIYQDTDGTLSNNLKGDGIFIKSGNGVMSIDQDDTDFLGMTTVRSGTLEVDGLLSNSVFTVQNGATLSGTGTVGSTEIMSGGNLAPAGNGRIGILNVNGDLNMSVGSVLSIDGSGSVTGSQLSVNNNSYRLLQSDLINVSGKTDLAGSTLSLNIYKSSEIIPNEAYLIIESKNGVSGKFDYISGNIYSLYAFLSPTLHYDTNDVSLLFQRNTVSFSEVGSTRNQKASGYGLEQIEASSPIVKAMDELSASRARKALDALSGEIHASARTAMIEDAFFVREAALDRLASAGCDGAYIDSTIRTAAVNKKQDDGKCHTDRSVFWGESYGSLGRNFGDGNAATMNHTTAGFIMGVDAPLFKTGRIGALIGYGSSTYTTSSGRSSSGHSNNATLGVYGGNHWGNLTLSLGASYTWDMMNTSRTVIFDGYQGNRLSSSYLGGTAQGFGEIGYKLHGKTSVFEPFAQVAYVNMMTNSFREHGGPDALIGSKIDTGVTFSTFGFRTSRTFKSGNTFITPHIMMGYRHAFGLTIPTAHELFAATGAGDMNVAGVPLTTDAAVVNAGFSIKASAHMDLGLSYVGQYGVQSIDNGIKAKITYKF